MKTAQSPEFSRDYEMIYESASAGSQEGDEAETEFFAGLIPAGERYRILDIGCAEGALAVRLAVNGHYVVASDIANGFLARGRQSAEKHGVDIHPVRCDIETDISGLDSMRFDYIYFMNVIEHLRSPIRGLENVRKLLADNGILFIHTPNACSITGFYTNLAKRDRITDFRNSKIVDSLHLQEYHSISLQRLCNFVGFEVKRVIPTRVTIPPFGLKSTFLAKLFPALSDNLLFECRRSRQMSIDEIIDRWKTC